MGPEDGQGGTDEVDGPHQVHRDVPLDLLPGALLKTSQQAAPGVADHHVEPSPEADGLIHGGEDALGAGDIEIDDPDTRAVKLREWMGLPGRLYVKTAGGRTVRATFDARQVGEERLSSVQYLKFDTGGEVPVAVGCDHPRYTAEVALSPDQRQALEADLRDA